jgi:hypothetical protein
VIILSGVLVVVAIALLVTGIVTGNTGHEILGLDGLKLIYVSIGVSIVSALFLAVGVFLRRKELFGTAVAPANAKASAGRTTARPVKAKARVGAGEDAPMVPATSATATDVPAETTVWVVPGRKRYHLETCRQLAGRDKEELTFVEAREEGFTACTACLPDTALAARAALTDAEPVDDRSAETRTATVTDIKPQSAALDPVEVTRTDIPVTPALPAAERPSGEERDALTGRRATTGGATESPKTDARDAESTIAEPAEAEPTSAEPTAAKAPEAPEETLVERSRRRSRSLFEPLERTESDTATADTPDAGSATDEKTGTGSADAGHRDEDEGATARSADEPETAEPQDAPAGADQATDAAATPEADDTDHAGSEAQDARAADATADGTVASGSGRDTAESEPAPSDEHGEDEEPVAAEAATEPEPVDDETDATDTTDAADDEPDADAAAPSTESSADADAEQAEEAEKAEEKAVPADDSGDAKADPTVRILSGTKRYHRSDCALIEDIADDADDLESMSREAARERGCTPCLVCQPDDD